MFVDSVLKHHTQHKDQLKQDMSKIFDHVKGMGHESFPWDYREKAYELVHKHRFCILAVTKNCAEADMKEYKCMTPKGFSSKFYGFSGTESKPLFKKCAGTDCEEPCAQGEHCLDMNTIFYSKDVSITSSKEAFIGFFTASGSKLEDIYYSDHKKNKKIETNHRPASGNRSNSGDPSRGGGLFTRRACFFTRRDRRGR